LADLEVLTDDDECDGFHGAVEQQIEATRLPW